ncbi:MAG TPA: hypothetical protein VIX73_31690 [Kofleriaceae bacterium]|jgi:hypothetical protein
MPDPTHITVTAPPDRVTPIHEKDGIAPGGLQMRVTAGFVARVRYSQSTRRAISRGDLIPCNMSGAAVPSADLAAAPEELPDGPMVKVVKEIGRALAKESR